MRTASLAPTFHLLRLILLNCRSALMTSNVPLQARSSHLHPHSLLLPNVLNGLVALDPRLTRPLHFSFR